MDARSRLRARLHQSLVRRPVPLFLFVDGPVPAATLWTTARAWLEPARVAGWAPGTRVRLTGEPSKALAALVLAGLWEGWSVELSTAVHPADVVVGPGGWRVLDGLLPDGEAPAAPTPPALGPRRVSAGSHSWTDATLLPLLDVPGPEMVLSLGEETPEVLLQSWLEALLGQRATPGEATDATSST